ncbi:piggyBac transposable element-derived protein 4-like [Bactrocera neohumeralis]|uniref:piggyBac transposable element-derived protein 4-like n=1 Tax=Bactrocera neohumeralis TaxID=98809 RepID=UPI002166AF81|nr:piggyBac transposable element-derived protein 4-like [Bactrocera neohumeralis]
MEPSDAFKLFISDEILNIVLYHTNAKISQLRNKYQSRNATVSNTSLMELKALLGLLYLSAVLKSNHLSTDILFDTSYSGDRYRATMSRHRFEFLLNSLRFDDMTTREERKKKSSFAPISEIWDIFVDSCTKNFKPGSYVTIDEQLVGFRGRCPFRMYIPNKPNKFGIKIVMVCDVATKYVINAEPYLGKSTNTQGKQLANYFVEGLTKPLHGSNRNITMDNWFTSIPLATKLLSNPYSMTIVGTLRKNKAEIPPELLDTKSRQCGSSRFVYNENMTLVSFQPKQNRNVLLLSTMHINGALDPTTKKPEIILTYNSTKGAVDTFDQMTQNICCNRKTKRWPLCFFYNMLNISSVNAYVLYSHNVTRNGLKPMSRSKFVLKLHEELTQPWQEERLLNARLPTKLKEKINEIIKTNNPIGSIVSQKASPQKAKRKYCTFCHYTKRRFTTTYCSVCKSSAICGEDQIKVCKNCVNEI